ncbi:unnamed protein product [marine sediment metagenome]|uniref:Uncharacterized protein n=1 Tax=marine sediment metagenome TaxID=412755 RepID=X1HW61_9ZZZZ
MMKREGLSPSIEVPDTIAELLAAGASVPFGQSGLVHVWGKNDMTTNQVMIISWVVREPPTAEYPEGRVAESYGDDAGTIGAGQDHEFIGGRFDINKAGNWTIAIGLFMNRADPVLVASYEGILCVVTAEEYIGSIVKKELEYDSVRGAIPVS